MALNALLGCFSFPRGHSDLCPFDLFSSFSLLQSEFTDAGDRCKSLNLLRWIFLLQKEIEIQNDENYRFQQASTVLVHPLHHARCSWCFSLAFNHWGLKLQMNGSCRAVFSNHG